MSLADAAYALDELAAGRMPDQTRVIRGLEALDSLLLQSGREQALYDAAAILELFVSTGGTISPFEETRVRTVAVADAVRRVMGHA